MADPDTFLEYEAIEQGEVRVLSIQLTTFGAFSSSIGRESYLKHVSPDRQVWIVQILWPKGFKHPRRGLIPNCLSITINDAETGTFISSIIDSVDDPQLLPSTYVRNQMSKYAAMRSRPHKRRVRSAGKGWLRPDGRTNRSRTRVRLLLLSWWAMEGSNLQSSD